MRDAPSIHIVRGLLDAGATVRAYDPVARPDIAAVWGDGARVTLVRDAMAAVEKTSALVVVTEWREFRSPDFAALRKSMLEPVLIDGRNQYEPELVAQFGFEYAGFGRAVTLRAAAPSALTA